MSSTSGGGDTRYVQHLHHQRPVVSIPTVDGQTSILQHQGVSAGPALKRARIQGYITPPPPPESSSAFVDVALPPESAGDEDVTTPADRQQPLHSQPHQQSGLYQEPAHQHVAVSQVVVGVGASVSSSLVSQQPPQQRYRHNPYDANSGKAMVVPEGPVCSAGGLEHSYTAHHSQEYQPQPSTPYTQQSYYSANPGQQISSSNTLAVSHFNPPQYQEPYNVQGQASNHSTHCRQQHHESLLRLQRYMEDQMPYQQPFSCFCDPHAESRSSHGGRAHSDGTNSAAQSSHIPGLSETSGERVGSGFVMSPLVQVGSGGSYPGPTVGSPKGSPKTGAHVGHFYPGQQPHRPSTVVQQGGYPGQQHHVGQSKKVPTAPAHAGNQGAKTKSVVRPTDCVSASKKVSVHHQQQQQGSSVRLLSPARRQVRIAPTSENTASSPSGPLGASGGGHSHGTRGQVARPSSITTTPGGRSGSSSKALSRSSSVGTKTSRFNSAHRSVSVGSRVSTSATSVSSCKRSTQPNGGIGGTTKRSPSVTSRRSCNSKTGSATSRHSGKSGLSACSRYSRASAGSRRSVQSKTIQALRKCRRQKMKEERKQARILGKLPQGTLHRALFGKVSFVPYPTGPFTPPRSSMFPSAGAVQFSSKQGQPVAGAEVDSPLSQHQSACGPLCTGGFHHHCTKAEEGSDKEGAASPWVRLFFGQLPYEVTQMQLDWLCFTFGFGRTVHDMERIFKFDAAKSCRVPTGCLHAYCHKDFVDDVTTGINRRLLVDDTGVWYARAGVEGEQLALQSYCEGMKNNKKQRIHCRPYDAVSVQLATSNRGSGGQPAPQGNYAPCRGALVKPNHSHHHSAAAAAGAMPQSATMPGGMMMPPMPPGGLPFHPWQLMQQQQLAPLILHQQQHQHHQQPAFCAPCMHGCHATGSHTQHHRHSSSGVSGGGLRTGGAPSVVVGGGAAAQSFAPHRTGVKGVPPQSPGAEEPPHSGPGPSSPSLAAMGALRIASNVSTTKEPSRSAVASSFSKSGGGGGAGLLTSPIHSSSEVGSPAAGTVSTNSRRSSGGGKKKGEKMSTSSSKQKKVTMFTLPDELTPKDHPLGGNATAQAGMLLSPSLESSSLPTGAGASSSSPPLLRLPTLEGSGEGPVASHIALLE